MVLATDRADVNGVVRRHLGVRKISFAPHDDAVSLTGMEFGGITPVGLPARLAGPRRRARSWPPATVVIGSGIRGSKLLVDGAALAAAAEVLDLAQLRRRSCDLAQPRAYCTVGRGSAPPPVRTSEARVGAVLGGAVAQLGDVPRDRRVEPEPEREVGRGVVGHRDERGQPLERVAGERLDLPDPHPGVARRLDDGVGQRRLGAAVPAATLAVPRRGGRAA